MLKLSVEHSSPVYGTQTVWNGGVVNNEPSQSYASPTQTESISEPEGLLDAIEVPFTLDWDQWLS